ncbi:unnamed protein product [Moneuplotes crassus]|uniref:Uncharacterized protein n=1 Tax=Euplotes crassus TaxID=5936 RepID=A0AAD1XHJ4_EUPCR|nr:unnamed protein product [Moneuplotes crassus]
MKNLVKNIEERFEYMNPFNGNRLAKYYIDRISRKKANYSKMHPSFDSCARWINLKQKNMDKLRIISDLLKPKKTHNRPIPCCDLLNGSSSTSKILQILSSLNSSICLSKRSLSPSLFIKILLTTKHLTQLKFALLKIDPLPSSRRRRLLQSVPEGVNLDLESMKFSDSGSANRADLCTNVVEFVLGLVESGFCRKLKKVVFAMMRLNPKEVQKIIERKYIPSTIEIMLAWPSSKIVFSKSKNGTVQTKKFDF